MKNDLKRINILLFLLVIILVVTNYNTLKQEIDNYLDVDNISTNDINKFVFNGDLISFNDTKKLEDSGIKTTSFTPNALYYPYYELLSKKEQILYGQIYENSINYKTKFVPIVNVNKDEFTRAIEAVYNDHPEIFWLNTNYAYKYLDNGKIVQIIMNYNYLVNDIDNAKKQFTNKINVIVSEANKYNTALEKEKIVHDYLINHTSYNKNSALNQSAYSAIVNGNSVCAGYSRAFQYIMNLLGIPTYYVTGYSSGEHAWNIVKLDDGYYNVDVTWDDKNIISYNYFNLSDSEIANTHKRMGLSEYLVKCNTPYYSNLNGTYTEEEIIEPTEEVEEPDEILFEENYEEILE